MNDDVVCSKDECRGVLVVPFLALDLMGEG